MTTLAIIPARGGSKRIPGKNLTPIAGVPMVCWTVYAALNAKRVDRVIVSTDDASIAFAAKRCGDRVEIHERPADLATDTATTESVMEHVLRTMGGEDWTRVVLLQPTSPLRSAARIDEAINLQRQTECDAVVSVTADPGSYFQWLVRGGRTGDKAQREYGGRPRTQDLAAVHRENGALYLATRSTWERTGMRAGTHADDVRALVMHGYESVDVDDYDSLRVAEYWLWAVLMKRSDEYRRYVDAYCADQ